MRQNKPAILLVEDDEIDIMSFERQVRKLRLDVPIRVARSALDALGILRVPPDVPGERPTDYIVLTDINMPGMSGHELIETIRRDPALRRTIVFVITSSSLATDVGRAYDSNVAGYIVKDSTGDRMREAVEMLQRFLGCVKCPAA